MSPQPESLTSRRERAECGSGARDRGAEGMGKMWAVDAARKRGRRLKKGEVRCMVGCG